MISLTEMAAGKVRELLEQEGRFDIALRVAVQPGGCSGLRYAMYLDDESGDGDVAAEQFGVRVVVDKMSAPYLQEAKIDYLDTLEQSAATRSTDSALEAEVLLRQQGSFDHVLELPVGDVPGPRP